MISFFDKFLENLAKPKYYLIAANFLLVSFLVLLSNLNFLPMKTGDFVFFSLIYLIFALYRPGWSFLFFVGTVALENINLAPVNLGISIRPFQMIGAMTILSLLLRHFSKRLNFQLVKLKWFDYVIGFFALSGFLSSFAAIDKGIAFKQSIIIFSFAALYWLVRNYIQNLDDLKRIVPFFLSSSIIVVFYGIFQNIRFMKGLNSFEVMPGRPNSTFTEPDWLGIFLVVLISVIYSIIYKISNTDPSIFSNYQKSQKIKLYISYIALVPVFILLILTVSRSAWLGAGFVTLVFLKAVLTDFSFKYSDWSWKGFLGNFLFVVVSVILSIGIVYVFHLTNFQLANRAQSTGGLQKITIACNGETNMPEKINDLEELRTYNCWHINLEDIEKEKNEGHIIKEIYRPDPNVNIRKEIYQKSIEQIKKHPIFGIGWGNSSLILGQDQQGNGLNSSNIFLEIWLGSGILGLTAFLSVWVHILAKGVIYVLRVDSESKIIGTFILLGFFAFLVPNLFNAGVYLGILWVWISAVLSTNTEKTND